MKHQLVIWLLAFILIVPLVGISSCPSTDVDADGYTADQGDCDDQDASVYPGASELCDGKDNDCDNSSDEDLDGDGDGVLPCAVGPSPADCDDADSSVHPDATEICDEKDNDCDAMTDEDVTTTYYQDSDGDGYGSATGQVLACTMPQGTATSAGDCNDTDASVHPDASEVCDGTDNNCSGTVDEGFDQDGDSVPTCAVGNAVADCNDADPAVHPGATEVCNARDDDCDGATDEGVLTTYYQDSDGDGYGSATASIQSCSLPSGYLSTNGDCDDTQEGIHPGAPESCNSKDDDCNGQVDEGTTTTYYQDSDGDGFGLSTATIQACGVSSGYSSKGGDCDDTRSSTYPGAKEYCNGVDSNCDGATQETIRYVSASANPSLADGLTWASAYTTIQAGINGVSSCGGEVWVAEGTYLPSVQGQPVATLANGVHIYGGFLGHETLLKERSGSAANTILSANFSADSSQQNNSNRVIEAASFIRIDRLTIADAYNGTAINMYSKQSVEIHDSVIRDNYASYSGSRGAALTCSSSTLTITDSQIHNNTAYDSGALALAYCTATISSSEFRANRASQSGGALGATNSTLNINSCSFMMNTSSSAPVMYIREASSSGRPATPVTIRSTIFENNTAFGGGIGAVEISAWYDTVIIEDSKFINNSVSSLAGGGCAQGVGALQVYPIKTLSIDRTLFQGNFVYDPDCGYSGAGGAVGLGYGIVTIRDSRFENNTAGYGGALALYSSKPALDIITTSFIGNRSWQGGAIYFFPGRVNPNRLFNVLFSQNTAWEYGGAIALLDNDMTITNSSFDGNGSASGGDSIYVVTPNSTTLQFQVSNSVFWDNDGGGQSNELKIDSDVTANFDRNCSPFSFAGQNIKIADDPFDRIETQNDPYLKHYGSCNDAGDDTAASSRGSALGLASDWWMYYESSAGMRDDGQIDIGFHHSPNPPKSTQCTETDPSACVCSGTALGDRPWIVVQSPERGHMTDSSWIRVRGIVYPPKHKPDHQATINRPTINGIQADSRSCGSDGGLSFQADIALTPGINTIRVTVSDSDGGTDESTISTLYSEHFYDQEKEIIPKAAYGLFNQGMWDHLERWVEEYLTTVVPPILEQPDHPNPPAMADYCNDANDSDSCGLCVDSYGLQGWIDSVSYEQDQVEAFFDTQNGGIWAYMTISDFWEYSSGQFYLDMDWYCVGCDLSGCSDDYDPFTSYMRGNAWADSREAHFIVTPYDDVAAGQLPLSDVQVELSPGNNPLVVEVNSLEYNFDVDDDFLDTDEFLVYLFEDMESKTAEGLADAIKGYLIEPDQPPIGAKCGDGSFDKDPVCACGTRDSSCCWGAGGIAVPCYTDEPWNLEVALANEVKDLFQQSYAVEVSGISYEVASAIQAIEMFEGGVDLTLAADLNYAKDSRIRNNPGALSYSDTSYSQEREPHAEVKVGYNLLNAALHAAWEAGGMIKENILIGNSTSVSIVPLLPPVIVPAEDPFMTELAMGDILVTTTVLGDIGNEPVITAMSLRAAIEIVPIIEENVIRFDLNFSVPECSIDVLDEQANPEAINQICNVVEAQILNAAETVVESLVRIDVGETWPVVVDLFSVDRDAVNPYYLSLAVSTNPIQN